MRSAQLGFTRTAHRCRLVDAEGDGPVRRSRHSGGVLRRPSDRDRHPHAPTTGAGPLAFPAGFTRVGDSPATRTRGSAGVVAPSRARPAEVLMAQRLRAEWVAGWPEPVPRRPAPGARRCDPFGRRGSLVTRVRAEPRRRSRRTLARGRRLARPVPPEAARLRLGHRPLPHVRRRPRRAPRRTERRKTRPARTRRPWPQRLRRHTSRGDGAAGARAATS